MFFSLWRTPDNRNAPQGQKRFDLKSYHAVQQKKRKKHVYFTCLHVYMSTFAAQQKYFITECPPETKLESLKITSSFFTECKQAFLACQHFRDISEQKAYLAKRRARKFFNYTQGLLISVSTFRGVVFRFNRRAYPCRNAKRTPHVNCIKRER